jgi:hypothetical protein
MSTVQNIIHFGLGDFKNISSVEVLWPDGKFQKLLNTKVNQKIILEYDNASPINKNYLTFPFVPKTTNPILVEISESIGVDYTHEEQDMIDYNVQRILPHKLTQNGPCLATGDLNGDGTQDFIIGSSSGFSPEIFLQNNDGSFIMIPLFTDDLNKNFEEEGIALFDLENDGDLDLYLVSGSNEFMSDKSYYNDRLMINDGKGNFILAKDEIPTINASGSVVSAYDFDADGYVDLFVGGRTPFAQYPLADKSFLLKNINGKLVDVTDAVAPGLKNIGMVTSAIWEDVDSDGLKDLVVVGEFMPITIFKNKKSSLSKLKNTGLDSIFGWWESIAAADFDKDGDIDFIVGNMGANNLYQPSKERPITLISKDFDNNGTVDPIMFAYFKGSFQNLAYQSFPVNFWGDLYGQSPLFRAKYNSYQEYAEATEKTLLNQNQLEGANKLIGNFDRSVYVENLGGGKFQYKQLPWEAQIAPINSIVITDYDRDDNLDVLLVGNDFGNEIFIGRYDAFNGCLLKGNGKGDFQMINTEESGFLVPGDAKYIIEVKNAKESNPYYIVSQNKGSLKVFQKK